MRNGHRASTRANELSYRDRWGILAAIQHSLLQRLSRVAGLHLYGIYSRPITASTKPDSDAPGFEVRLFQRGDEQRLLACARRPELELSAKFVIDALGKGDMCAVVLRNGEIVSFDWSAFTPTHVHDGVYVEFDHRYRYGYFAFTLPEYRGLHLPRLTLSRRNQYCVDRGFMRSISYISVDNQASIRMSEANGNRRIGYAGYLKLGPVFVSFRTPGVRKHGFRFFMPDRRFARTSGDEILSTH